MKAKTERDRAGWSNICFDRLNDEKVLDEFVVLKYNLQEKNPTLKIAELVIKGYMKI